MKLTETSERAIEAGHCVDPDQHSITGVDTYGPTESTFLRFELCSNEIYDDGSEIKGYGEENNITCQEFSEWQFENGIGVDLMMFHSINFVDF